MQTKAPVKKAKKPSRKTKGMQTSGMKLVRKTVKKSVKKITWDEIKEGFKEIHQANKELHDSIFGSKNTFDSFVEQLMSPDILQKFRKFGFSFNILKKIKFAQDVYAEIDALFDNGIQAVVVKITTPLLQADIDDHILRMEKVRKHADEYNDKRQFMGAIAATITDKSTREYALKKSLFLIEPSGENVKVTKPEGDVTVW